MTNVFRRVIVGMFTAMLLSLYLSVGQKGNKHCLRGCVTYRVNTCSQAYIHIACGAFRLFPEWGNSSYHNKSLLLTVLEWHRICWMLKLMANFIVTDYVFVTPVKVDASGSYISHNVLHSTRKKRSTHSSRSSLHYKFSAFGQELHLELKPSTILSNSFVVQVLGKDGVSNSQEHEIEQCFYQGFIRNDSTSSVAISTCVGLVSVSFKQISTQNYFHTWNHGCFGKDLYVPYAIWWFS